MWKLELPESVDEMSRTEAICNSLGVPHRVFVGDNDEFAQSSLMGDLLDERDKDRRAAYQKVVGERVIQPITEECWYQASRVKRVSVGQEKRDFFRAMAKLSGIKQVGMKPKVVWQ